jgi:hypothetical protein
VKARVRLAIDRSAAARLARLLRPVPPRKERSMMSSAVHSQPARLATPPAAGPAPGPAMLGSRMAPPFRLPAEHFAVALGFWVVGALGLVWAAPEIARGWFVSPRVVALTHLFTLGWITVTIQGALYQFLPVALGQPIRSQRLAHLSLVLFAPGLAGFVYGLVAGVSALTIAGAVLFSLGLLLFVGNLAATLWCARHFAGAADAAERRLTWWALVGATVFLAATVFLGVALSGNLRWGFLGAERFLALGVHLHVAVAGWVMLVIVGVAHRLLPMFLLSHGAPSWPGAVAVGLLWSGVGLLLGVHHALSPLLMWVIAGMIIGGVLSFLLQAVLFFRHRRKPALDPGLRLAASGIAFLLVALGLAPFALHAGLAAPHLATAYVLVLVLGALSLFVAGHYYKIFPFLVWFHRFGPMAGRQPVPRVADLYADRPANAAVALLVAGVVGLAAATLFRAEWAARPAALLFAGGALIVAAQMWTISRRRPE